MTLEDFKKEFDEIMANVTDEQLVKDFAEMGCEVEIVMKQKFGEMTDGQRFTDGRHQYIKLQTILPSGYRQIHQRVVNQDPEGNLLKKPTPLDYNSVDEKGIPAKCPDWLEFELL